jgi:hypothetical protein
MTIRQLFVSYSRRDREVVSPMTAILRLAGAEVFRDEDSIPPGTKWQEAINTSITDCHCLVVFWSANAAASDAVRYEYMHGATLKKDIAPILMDDTPMTPELRQFQAIDFRPAALKIEATKIPKQTPAPNVNPLHYLGLIALPIIGIPLGLPSSLYYLANHPELVDLMKKKFDQRIALAS